MLLATSVSRGIRRFSTLRSIHFVEVKHEFNEIIKWHEPTALKSYDQQISCDLRGLGTVDPRTLKLEYQPFAAQIDKLPEHERKLFTIALGNRKDMTDIIKHEMTSLVKNHKYDKGSFEYKVSKLTFQIRNFQAVFQNNPRACKGRIKTLCLEAISKRHKLLTYIKLRDVKQFEWIIQLLGIIFKPLPESYKRLLRKSCLENLTEIYCNAIRSKRMFEYRLELESQKIPFLEEKLATLQQIKSEEESMNLSCSVEETIQETIKRIENLRSNPVEIKPQPQMELVPTCQMPFSLYRVGATKDSVRY